MGRLMVRMLFFLLASSPTYDASFESAYTTEKDVAWYNYQWRGVFSVVQGNTDSRTQRGGRGEESERRGRVGGIRTPGLVSSDI